MSFATTYKELSLSLIFLAGGYGVTTEYLFFILWFLLSGPPVLHLPFVHFLTPLELGEFILLDMIGSYQTCNLIILYGKNPLRIKAFDHHVYQIH